MRVAVIILFVSLANIGIASPPPKQKAARLESYQIEPNSLTVSGISSGGMMSAQYHFIYSSEVKGAGIFAGGPYLCGYGGPIDASICMLTPGLQSLAWFIPFMLSEANILSLTGQISPVSNLKDSKVYIFHGSEDSVVKPLGGEKLRQMYAHYGADVHAEFSIPCAHGQPVNGNGHGGPCGQLNLLKSFVNECGYNGAYEMFKVLYGENMTEPASDFIAQGDLITFDQEEFFEVDPLLSSMAREGLIYIPTACKDRNTNCKLHIAFHGCMANEHVIGDDFATKTQYIETCELNNVICMFPQTTSTLVSPIGCWDWFGFTGMASFATKIGNQPFAVRKMARRVMGEL